MNLLNNRSILTINNEHEETIHQQEIESFINELLIKKNYECAVLIKYIDEKHKDEELIIKSCNLHNCYEMIEYADFKNGIDLAIINGFITFITYGQNYSVNDKVYMVNQAVQIRPYNKNREFITFDNL